MGGSFGTAVFGAIFANLLVGNLKHYLVGVKPPAGLTGASVSPAALAKLPAAVHGGYVQAYAHSLQTVFLVAAPIAAVAFLLTCLMPELETAQDHQRHRHRPGVRHTDRSQLRAGARAGPDRVGEPRSPRRVLPAPGRKDGSGSRARGLLAAAADLAPP